MRNSKRIVALVLALVLALSVCVSASAATVLKKGSSGTAVRRLQEKLVALGYGDIKCDGKYGDQTVDAVKRFQVNNGLVADGKAGPRTLSKLYDSDGDYYTTDETDAHNTVNNNPISSTLNNETDEYGGSTMSNGDMALGSTGPAVRKMQTRLNALGYKLKADGTFGPKTLSALKAFQTLNGLTADGVAGATTLDVLYSDSAIHNRTKISYPTLRRGASGAWVKKVQQFLYDNYYYNGLITGYYSQDTEEAVTNYQRDHGLTDDGKAGPSTLASMFGTYVNITK